MSRVITYSQALCEAQDICLEEYPSCYVMGLGVPDPKGIFGSTTGLQEKFGAERVFDIPLSENAMTGVALGSAVTGMRPILTHQRVDFSLVSIEQIVNQIAKWRYMFGGRMRVPLVIRMVVGRGWGQGPQHSQSLQSWFAHVPGLRVIMPTTPYDAKGMLISAVEDDNPVISLEHRWLYGIEDDVPEDKYNVPIDRARVVKPGTDVSIVGVSYMALESLRAANLLENRGLQPEVIDLRSISPLDMETISASVTKTRRLLVVDNAHLTCGISAEIIARATERHFGQLVGPPKRLGFPEYPTPTSPRLANDFYPLPHTIANAVLEMHGRPGDIEPIELDGRQLDQPDPSFKGPF